MADQNMPPVADHEQRLAAARQVAQWHLGYSSWADKIVGAYLDPAMALAELRREQERP